MRRRWYDLDRNLFFGTTAFDDLHRQINELFERSTQTRSAPRGISGSLYETDDEYVLRIDAAGLAADDFELTLHDDILTLKAERTPATPEGYSAVRRERPAVRWNQSIRLPKPTDSEKVLAELTDGVLRLQVGKREIPSPRQIQIQVS